jgi:hypothetical protein
MHIKFFFYLGFFKCFTLQKSCDKQPENFFVFVYLLILLFRLRHHIPNMVLFVVWEGVGKTWEILGKILLNMWPKSKFKFISFIFYNNLLNNQIN